MVLFIAPILFIAAVLYVAYPLLKGGKSVGTELEQSQRELLLHKKEEAVGHLKDIEMDYQMGKLSQEDYESLKVEFEYRAAEILRELESLPKGKGKKRKS